MNETSSDFFDKDDLNAIDKSVIGSANYVIGEKIYCSSTGFCQIHLARRLGRLFILKSLRPEYRGDTVANAALRKEFQIGFMIDNPGVVRTFDLSSDPDIGSFIALEYCRGVNLREFMDSGQEISFEQLERISHDLIETVRTLHAQGVLHRDIKPSNIIFDELGGRVKLIDFSCADTFDQSMFKGRAGTELYQSSDFTNQPGNDWYALSLTLAELADYCPNKRKKRLLPIFEVMRQGLDPDYQKRPRRSRWWIVLSLAFIAIVGTVLFLYLRQRWQEEPVINNEHPGSTELNDSVGSEVKGQDFDLQETHPISPDPDSQEAKDVEVSEGKRDAERNGKEDNVEKSENAKETPAVNENKPVDVADEKRVEEEEIDPKAIEAMRRMIANIASDVYNERVHKYQQKKYYQNASQNELSDLEGELFNEATCTRAIMGRIRHFPRGVPIDTIKKIVKQNYDFYFHHYIPIYERYERQYKKN